MKTREMVKSGFHAFFGACAAAIVVLAGPALAETTTMWVQADALGPAWGLYPISAAYGETKPLDQYAAFANGSVGRLTWVADFPEAATYQVWVRRYGGRAGVTVLINEQPVSGGRGGPGGARYVWRHKGAVRIPRGSCHVDIVVDNTMFDAILFSTDAGFVPQDDNLPESWKDPVVRAARRYRDDQSLAEASGTAGFVVGTVEPYQQHHNDLLPAPDGIVSRVELWGAPNQYITGEFAVRALAKLDDFRVVLSRLQGPGGHEMDTGMIDLKLVHLREREIRLFRSTQATGAVPDLLVRDETTGTSEKGDQGGFGGGAARCAIPAHESRHFVVTVRIPEGFPAGVYEGHLELSSREKTLKRLPVSVEVLPIDLKPVEGYYGAYYRTQPLDPDKSYYVPPDVFREQLETMAQYGMNATTLYGGFETAHYAAAAGLTGSPMIMRTGVQQEEAREQLAEAERMGLAGLLWHGVDEPRTAERIALARTVALRRRGWNPPRGIMMAINNRQAYDALQDVISNPVLNIKVFDATSNAAREARERGFFPISYWVTGLDFPLNIRAWTGLYNTAAGYLGTAPWAFYDKGSRDATHDVIVPDENGRSIPTLRLYAYRDGVDDVRYLQALDRAMDDLRKAVTSQPENQRLHDLAERAKEVRTRHFESINESWHWYLCRLLPDEYDTARRAFAETTVMITSALGDATN